MFEQVVFAGGGNRCFWQAGWWDVVAPAIELRPRLIAGVSAGAATACMLYANTSRYVLNYYREQLASNGRNVYLLHLLRPGVPMFPHAAIFSRVLKEAFSSGAFQRLKVEAPEIRVQFTRLPRPLGPRLGAGVGMIAYNIEKYWRRSLHPTLGRRLGFVAEFERVQDCNSDSDLISLLLASSCTPPFTPLQQRAGRPALDGGLVDNVPVSAVERGVSTLVLVTRRYPGRPQVFTTEGRLYVQPSERIPVRSWDYTDPEGALRAYDLGRSDGERFLDGWRRRHQWVEQFARVGMVDDSKGLEA